MLIEPNETAFDWRFRLLNTPVRVHVGFWIFSAVMGWNLLQSREANGMLLLAIWIACAFVSILLHEFGHILAGRLFGSDGYIVLYSFGGLAVGSRDQFYRWQRIIVSLAGPGIQLILWGGLWLLLEYVIRDEVLKWSVYARRAYGSLLWINGIWALFNLLPVWPLDGGMVCRDVCEGVNRQNGLKISLGISVAAAAFMALNSYAAINGEALVPWLAIGDWYVVILFGLLALESFMILRQVIANPWGNDEGEEWKR
jgi:Zn-dependent protease